MPGEIDEDNRTVAEEVVAARERQDRGTVELIVDRRAAFKRVADPAHGRGVARCHPVVFGSVQINRHSRQIQKPAHVVPVRVCRQGEIDVGAGVSLLRERGYRREDIAPRSHCGSQHGRKLRDSTYSNIDADAWIHDEGRCGVVHHERRERVLDPSRVPATLHDECSWDRTRHLPQRGNRHRRCGLRQSRVRQRRKETRVGSARVNDARTEADESTAAGGEGW
jgi:hypothetical protein